MDLEPTLKQAVRRITQVLHDFGRKHGWHYAVDATPHGNQHSYYIEVVVNED